MPTPPAPAARTPVSGGRDALRDRPAPAAAMIAADAAWRDPATFSCQACGACCAYSAEWPRFSLESDAQLALIPPAYVDDDAGRMRCDGDRCSALVGKVGEATACAVYAVRPDVCHTCQPGDDECLIARARHGL